MSRTASPLEPSTIDCDDTALAWRRMASRAAHPSNAPLGADVLATIAAGLAEATVPWELRTGDVPAERSYERLLVTPTYEVWVICWPAGTSLDLHDHGGSAGAFAVVSGELDEIRPSVTSTSVRRLGPGDHATLHVAEVHGVANAGLVPATSIHVYSPPLESTAFDERDASLPVVHHDRGTWGDDA